MTKKRRKPHTASAEVSAPAPAPFDHSPQRGVVAAASPEESVEAVPPTVADSVQEEAAAAAPRRGTPEEIEDDIRQLEARMDATIAAERDPSEAGNDASDDVDEDVPGDGEPPLPPPAYESIAGEIRARDVVIEAFEQLHLLARSNSKVSGLRTGFTRLDRIISGLQPGTLTIVASRPGMGKTAFCTNLAINASHSRWGTEQAAGVLFFSIGTPKHALVRRMLSSEARVDSTRIRSGEIHRDDWQNLAQAAGTLSDLPVFLDDTVHITIEEIARRVRAVHAEHGLSLVVVDYVQLISSVRLGETREREMGDATRGLKLLARELNIPVIAVSTLNRGVEARGNKDKRPLLTDLRDSGTLEDEADLVLLIYRDEVYNRETLDEGIAEIILAKGPLRTRVPLRFFEQYSRFDNLSD